ncbi:hypothetical protein Q8F55_001364 [Vanrija albida]|uniref:Uncharacterized protein n=1 Tax=Vanrija albida TaxID=181172 RepID=A0ABR3QFV9_9TREE
MSDAQALFMGLVHTVQASTAPALSCLDSHNLQGVGESAFAIVSSAWGVVYTFVHGLVVLFWDILESFAAFLGASVNFVISNIVLLIVLAVGFVVYRSRAASKPAAAVRRGKKKTE